MKNGQTNHNEGYLTKRIGSTTYCVKVLFSPTGQETMEDKMLRMIRNECGGYTHRVHQPQPTNYVARSYNQ